MVKPFDVNELAAHVRALLRQGHLRTTTNSKLGVKLDPSTFTVTYASELVRTPGYQLLELFLRNGQHLQPSSFWIASGHLRTSLMRKSSEPH